MKKYSLLAILAATILFTGCSQKTVEMEQKTPTSSESALNTVETTTNSSMNKMDDMDMMIKDGKGNYFVIGQEKEVINSIYFAFDKYSISEDQRKVALENAQKLSGLGMNTNIKVEGNCDEWGTDEYNYALGLKRAKVVKDALVADGITASKISVVSFGESNPVCSDKTSECWSKNRRAEYKPLP